MARKQVMLSFPEEAIEEPIIYNLGQQFRLVTNIHQANVSDCKGWITLELEGQEKDIEDGIDWVTSKGVRVDTVA